MLVNRVTKEQLQVVFPWQEIEDNEAKLKPLPSLEESMKMYEEFIKKKAK